MARESQKQRNDELKRQILETALQIGLEEGFEALSVRKIIKKMNYSTGIIYYHFKNRQEIIDALIKWESAALGEKIKAINAKNQGIMNTMENVFRMITDLAIKEPEKYNLIVMRKFSNKSEAKPVWVHFLAQKLKDAMANKEIKNLHPYNTAFSVWSSYLGFNFMMSLQRDLTEAQVEEMFKTQTEIIFRGICL